MSATATWHYPRAGSQNRDFTFTDDHIAAIRDLAVYWDATEHGAPGLAEAFLEIEEPSSPLSTSLEIFFDNAKFAATRGIIRNPYAVKADTGLKDTLADIPDKAIAALFQSGMDFEVEVSGQDRALWQEANLGACGIDCKRPYGSGQVARDIRAIVDPDESLKPAAFKALARTLEARMAVVLQFFVQTAKITPGVYRREDGYRWHLLDPAEADAAEQIDRDEWIARVSNPFFYHTSDYIRTAKAVWELVFNDRLRGDYADLCAQLRLTDIYGEDRSGYRYEGETVEQALTGLGQFPETSGVPLQSVLTILTLRMLNAHARFDEALALFDTARLKPTEVPPLDWEKPAWAVAVFFEHIIARFGSGQISRAAFEDTLNGRAPHYRNDARMSYNSKTYDIIYGRGVPENVPLAWLRQLQAACLQIRIMQGPFIPDED